MDKWNKEKQEELQKKYKENLPETGDVYVGTKKGNIYERDPRKPDDVKWKGVLISVEEFDKELENVNEKLEEKEELLEKKERFLMDGAKKEGGDEIDSIDRQISELGDIQANVEELRDELIDKKATLAKYKEKMMREDTMKEVDGYLKRISSLLRRTDECLIDFKEERTKEVIGHKDKE